VAEQPWRPTRAQLEEARGRPVPAVIGPGLRVVFCGINPSLYSAAVGHHFARPGNRFWAALHGAGFTERQLSPFEDAQLLAGGLGCTNLVEGATARADELTPAELREGAAHMAERLRPFRPAWLAVLGVGAYRVAFDRPHAELGPQPDRLNGTATWVLPNPSGLNASYQLPALVERFATLREAAGRPRVPALEKPTG
jgi:TDG/mug DNA glycosylase family protein